jgi:hypothetical protein
MFKSFVRSFKNAFTIKSLILCRFVAYVPHMKVILIFLCVLTFSSCSFERLYQIRQQRKLDAYEQIDFADVIKRYFGKDKTSVGTIEGIYSVSSLVTKKGKGLLSSTEKEKTVERDENYSKVAIIQDANSGNREYIEVPLDKTFLPSYSVRGEFTGMTDGNIMVYKHFESRKRTSTYTFTYDKSRDILEGVRTENNGSFTYTYKLTYLKLYPKSGG